MRYDLSVIGAGSGGLTTAAFAASLGAKVVLIERGEMGGDCLNYGCVPSKALIAAANRGDSFEKAMFHVKRAIAEIAPNDSVERFEGLGVTVIKGEASFRDAKTVLVNDIAIEARRFVIATGSRAFVPPNVTNYLTNETLFDLKEQPEHLVILGAGAMGVEMAQAFNKLGSKVTLIARNNILPKEDVEAAAILRKLLISEGINILENTTEYPRGYSHLLVAAGRLPNIERLNLDKAGILFDEKGIIVDKSLRSSHKSVYAIGDVTGREAFTHVAGNHGSLVAQQILFGKPINAFKSVIPTCIYTHPEISSVGMTSGEFVRADFTHNDRAIAENKIEGFLKIYHKKGVITGASIVAEGAGEMISLYTLAINKGLKLSDIAQTIFPYPTLSEAGKRASGEYFKGFARNKYIRSFVKMVQRF